jgi:hypothetical protein
VTIVSDWHGNAWADGHAVLGGITTVLPPNGPSCQLSNAANAVSTAGSYHRGGCHVLLTDGAVRFVTENIEAGTPTNSVVTDANNNAGQESLYGVWGAAGTRNGSENKSL